MKNIERDIKAEETKPAEKTTTPVKPANPMMSQGMGTPGSAQKGVGKLGMPKPGGMPKMMNRPMKMPMPGGMNPNMMPYMFPYMNPNMNPNMAKNMQMFPWMNAQNMMQKKGSKSGPENQNDRGRNQGRGDRDKQKRRRRRDKKYDRKDN